MTRFAKNFREFCDEHELDILTPEQKDAYLKGLHICAYAGAIAVSHDTLAVNGGNLRYYAGLEYNRPVLEAVTDTDCYRVYELSGKKDNVYFTHKACMALFKGVPYEYEDDFDDED